ncbi:alkaline phosphatase [Streptomyces sp. AcH 505]|uniref:alkaline phosphatase D family protein n=2 Tax=unclassified Streptomyces TaxID=2593676 RepID=UPI0005923011|nr:alkaline phosphatase D family protein [Streptomyces sp. NBC_00370]KIF71783.1 alkaline phosphatase [Streptomyces sp. AcH 505]
MTMPELTRRRLLAAGAAASGAVAASQLLTAPAAGAAGRRPLAADPFTLGVASGDPLTTAVVIWTRLAVDPLNGGGMPDSPVAVQWQVAQDQSFRKVVRRGVAIADPDLAHSVHVDVRGLEPGRVYWYRFRAGTYVSPAGRTRTIARDPSKLRVALASCQNWQNGYFTPYADMREQEPDIVLFVGDYIYESAPTASAVRVHEGSGEPYSLLQYRNRYAQYKTDPDLLAMHAAAPWIVTFDDHEVDNDFAGDVPQDPAQQSHDAFVSRLTAAYQAYYEHMPVRASAVPNGPHLQMYRSFDFGRLARLNVLDTRQFRSDQTTTQAGAEDPAMTMLGAPQRAWLAGNLASSHARWNLTASQIMMAETDLLAGPGKEWFYDAWDGYQVERNDLLARFRQVDNPVVLSGDRHLTMISDLKRDYADPGSAVVGAEFVGTSISSNGDQDATAFNAMWDPLRGDNPHWKVIDYHRGYHLFDIGERGIDAQVRVVGTVLKPQSASTTLSSLRVDAGRPGVHVV